METTPRLHDVPKSAPDRDADVELFFDTLRKAQARFMETVAEAQWQLGRDSGQLAHVAAIQGRLTRQFFDAQRSIMMRRAEVDAEVARIAAAAEDSAAAIIAAAQAKVAAGVVRDHPAERTTVRSSDAVRLDLDGAFDGALDVLHRSARQEVAALGVSVLRTMAEADALARVIDEAFEPDEPDSASAELQLTALLDDWWRAENQEGRAVIDDANARAAMRRHIAGIEAGEILETTIELADDIDEVDEGGDAGVASDTTAETSDVVELAGSEPKPGEARQGEPSLVLPSQMLAVLETADPAALQLLLATLAESLETQPAARVVHGSTTSTPFVNDPAGNDPPRGDMVIKLDQEPAPIAPSETAPEETFRSFWVKGSGPSASRWGWQRMTKRIG